MKISELAKILGVQYQTIWKKAKLKQIGMIESEKGTLEIHDNDVFDLLCYLRLDPMDVQKEKVGEILGRTLPSCNPKKRKSMRFMRPVN
jgi:hypothetical protein